jgi:hypothetical protein
LRPGIATTVIVGIVIVIIVVGGVAAYLVVSAPSKTTTSTSVSTSTSPSMTSTSSTMQTTTSTGVTSTAPSVNSSVYQFVADFQAKDVAGMDAYYQSNALSVWDGDAGGTAGNYSGTGNIQLVLSTTVGHLQTGQFTVTIGNVTETVTSADNTTVVFGLHLTGTSTVVGAFNSSIIVTQYWVYQSNKWTIAMDNWNYLYFHSTNTSEATVFPQWGLSLNGKSPNLADEHVVEWDVAPYLAVGTYVAILALALFALMVRKRKPAT